MPTTARLQAGKILVAASIFFGLLALALLLFSLAYWLEAPPGGTGSPGEWLTRLDGAGAVAVPRASISFQTSSPLLKFWQVQP